MRLQFDANTPIYSQIMGNIKVKLIRGEMSAGEKVEPVRELAVTYGVNPNTIQKALSELEREGYLFSERTAGRFVTKESERIMKLRQDETAKLVQNFITQMRELGVSPDEMRSMLELHIKQGGKA